MRYKLMRPPIFFAGMTLWTVQGLAFAPAVVHKIANRSALLSAVDGLALVPTSRAIEGRPLDSGRAGFSVTVSRVSRLVVRRLDGAGARHLTGERGRPPK